MSGGALVTMLLILGVVWGGFTILLAYALRREAAKRRDASTPDMQDADDRGALVVLRDADDRGSTRVPPSSRRETDTRGQDADGRDSHETASDQPPSNDQET